MLTRKQESTLMKVDIIIMVLSLIGIIVSTAIIIVVTNNMRYLFTVELICAIYLFAKEAKKVEKCIKFKKKEKRDKALRIEIA